MVRKQSYLAFIFVAALLWNVSSLTGGQLASRSAEDWSKTLDQASRVESLRIDEVVDRLGLKPGEVVADLGAGTGLFSVALGNAVAPDGRVYAVEIDKDYFPIIDRRTRANRVSNVRTVLGEFKDPKLPARDVDLAFMHDVLHHVEDRASYLQAAARYVKPAGRFVIIDFKANQGPHRDQTDLNVSEEQVAGWMRTAGFSKIERVDLFSDKYFLILSR